MLGERLIKAFGQKIGLELELDESHSCTFEADNTQITLTYLPETEEIMLLGRLAVLPVEGREPLLLQLLRANYLFNSTHGATLSINPETDEIALCKMLPCMVVDDSSFYTLLEHFVNTAELYANIINTYAERGAAPAAEQADSMQFNNFMSV